MILPINNIVKQNNGINFSSNVFQKYMGKFNTFPNSNENFENESPNNSKLKKVAIGGGIVGGITSLTALAVKIFKPSKTKNLNKIVKKLIKELQPQDIEFAKEIFPSLVKNSETLGVKPEHYNTLIKNISQENKGFMSIEGIDLISSKIEKFKDIMSNPVEDLSQLISCINKDNKNVFASITDNLKTLKLSDMDDLTMFLEKLDPAKNDYMFNRLLPIINKYKKQIGVTIPERYLKLLNHMTFETDNVIPQTAEIKIPEGKSIDKYLVLLATNKENKNCVIPLLNNVEKFDYKTSDIINILKSINNSSEQVIKSVSENIDHIKEMNLPVSEILSQIKNEEDLKIFDMVIKNTKILKVKDYSDIKEYLKKLDSNNIEFISKKIIPLLELHSDNFNIQYPDQIIDIVKNITPETISGIEIVGKYAKTYGPNLYYPALLEAITKENLPNLEKFMKNVKTTEVWNNGMVSAQDFKELLK